MSRGRVLLAAPRSFCAGVDRAIEIVERLLEDNPGKPVYVRHAIVHNDHVLRRLEGLGAVFVEHEDEIPEGAICVLSAHGVAPAVKENAQARGLRVVDATCPLVNKVHAEARRYADSGHLVALVGHKNHVEVIGTLGERPDSTVVIESPEQARELVTDKPVAVITQTTLSLDDVAPIVNALGDHLGSLRRPGADDICYATQNRQDAVKAMVSKGATLVLVIGSETSSNAQRLVEVAQAAGAQATMVDGESELDEALLEGHEIIGLTAGASTPEELVRATAARLAEVGYALPEEIQVAIEDVHFRLPKEVARR
jgi:4-hydroxy-3-methylbut-2-enyl diphosphate reductase